MSKGSAVNWKFFGLMIGAVILGVVISSVIAIATKWPAQLEAQFNK